MSTLKEKGDMKEREEKVVYISVLIYEWLIIGIVNVLLKYCICYIRLIRLFSIMELCTFCNKTFDVNNVLLVLTF